MEINENKEINLNKEIGIINQSQRGNLSKNYDNPNLEKEIIELQNTLKSHKILDFKNKTNIIAKDPYLKKIENADKKKENKIKPYKKDFKVNTTNPHNTAKNIISDLKKQLKLKEKEKNGDNALNTISARRSSLETNTNTRNLNNYPTNVEVKGKSNLSMCLNDELSKAVLNNNSTISNEFKGNLEDYKIIKEIGKGSYAVVKQALHKPSNLNCAIKFYDKTSLIDNQKEISVRREIEILRKVEHKNIVKLYEVIETPKQILIIMELVEGHSLFNYLRTKPTRRLDEKEGRLVFQQILEGMIYLHSKNIYHRDIKLENLIIDKQKTVKIIDFGFGVFCEEDQNDKTLNFFCGTPSYMPPEIVQKKQYLGDLSDIWSCGVLLYTLLVGNFPFNGLSESEIYSKIIKGSFNIPTYISNEIKILLKKILNPVPNLRITSDEILTFLNKGRK